MPLDNTVNRKGPPQITRYVKLSNQLDNFTQAIVKRCRVEMAAGHELGDRSTDGVEHANDRRSNAKVCGAHRRFEFVGPIDAEQVGLLAGYPNHKHSRVVSERVVAIGDSAGKRRQFDLIETPVAKAPPHELIERVHAAESDETC